MLAKTYDIKSKLVNFRPEIAKKIKFSVKGDYRGYLVPIENCKDIPFDIKRIFYIYGTKEKVPRGNHAHRNLKQILICLNGSCKVKLDNGKQKEIIELSSPEEGILIDKLVWVEMYDFSVDCILLVLTDGFYDESEYIRDYSEFIDIISNKAKE